MVSRVPWWCDRLRIQHVTAVAQDTAEVQFQSLAQELSYAVGVATKKKMSQLLEFPSWCPG